MSSVSIAQGAPGRPQLLCFHDEALAADFVRKRSVAFEPLACRHQNVAAEIKPLLAICAGVQYEALQEIALSRAAR